MRVQLEFSSIELNVSKNHSHRKSNFKFFSVQQIRLNTMIFLQLGWTVGLAIIPTEFKLCSYGVVGVSGSLLLAYSSLLPLIRCLWISFYRHSRLNFWSHCVSCYFCWRFFLRKAFERFLTFQHRPKKLYGAGCIWNEWTGAIITNMAARYLLLLWRTWHCTPLCMIVLLKVCSKSRDNIDCQPEINLRNIICI